MDFYKVNNNIFKNNDNKDDNCKIYNLKRGNSYEIKKSYEI